MASAKHALTKEDVRTLRWAAKCILKDVEVDPSGDLYHEECAELKRALKNLPKLKDLPKGRQMVWEPVLNRCIEK